MANKERKFDALGWPEQMTILGPDDLIHGTWVRGEGCNTRGCLMGWIGVNFASSLDFASWYREFSPAASEFLHGVLRRLGVSNAGKLGSLDDYDLRYVASDLFEAGYAETCWPQDVFELPDGRPSDEQVCQAWNAEVEARGYVVEVDR